jgi:hypothetical protein
LADIFSGLLARGGKNLTNKTFGPNNKSLPVPIRRNKFIEFGYVYLSQDLEVDRAAFLFTDDQSPKAPNT